MADDEKHVRVDITKLISPAFLRAYADILASKDTDPKSPFYGQKLREYFFSGGRGCVDGDTLLDTPDGRVKVRDFNGGIVYSYDGNGIIETYACKPIRYTREPLYRVSLSNGMSVSVTGKHRFLTRSGWKTVDSLSSSSSIATFPFYWPQASLRETRDSSTIPCVSVRNPLVSSASSCEVPDRSMPLSCTRKDAHGLRESSCEERRKESPEDALRSTRTLLSCLYHYWTDFRRCDGLPPTEEETYLSVVRRLADVPEHIRGNSHEGDPGGAKNGTRSEERVPRLSMPDCRTRLAGRYCEETENRILRTLSESLSSIFPSTEQCLESGDLDGNIRRVAELILSSTRPVSDCPNDHTRSVREDCILQMLFGMLRRSVHDESFSDSFTMNEDVVSRTLSNAPVNITKIEFEKEDYYYDLFVPFYNCYYANGILHHNSTKSSFVSLMIVLHLLQNSHANAVVFVRVAENIRDSVYKQILWAIDHLELNAFFKCTTSPFRCTYIPTGQEILFRGLDKAGKIKGIRPSVGYFDTIWFEELTEFANMEDCRSVIQSALRGGDEDNDEIGENVRTWEFYSYNPPPTLSNWVNVEVNRVVPGRKVYRSNYLSVNPRWLGRNFFERAEVLKVSNERAYRHEYLGEITGTGGNIFNNLEIRDITDEEINTLFDNRCFGIDWGFANDPFVWLAMNFDRNHRRLYIFDEIVALGKRTQETAEMVRKKMARIGGNATVWADCAEPDSIADYNAWGVRCEGCPKPHGAKWSGRDYEFKALQDLDKIIIDRVYCPKTAAEFQKLEYPKNAHGDFISQYPHSDEGDAARYGCFFALREAGLLTI